MKWTLVAAALPFVFLAVQADFGDYVDPTFNCPAMTTCRQVCVPTVSECPLEMLCADGEQLCLDGSCALQCTGNEVTPCEHDCAPVACAKVIDTIPNCGTKYGPLLDFEAECGELEVATETRLLKFTEPGFIITYLWIVLSTVFVLAWCVYNQRMAPVEGSTKPLDLDFSKSAEKVTSKGFQTGYSGHPVGNAIYFMTLGTLLGFHVILGWLSLQYYALSDLFPTLSIYFEDEVQSLTAFIAIWCKYLYFVYPVAACLLAHFRVLFSRWILLDICNEVSVLYQKLALPSMRTSKCLARRNCRH